MSISANAQITLINMSEAYTVLLTNESQQFPTNSSRVPLSNVSYYTDIVVYQGSTERTDYTIGTVSSSNHITVSQTASRVTFTVSTSSTISSDSGTFTIPITIDGQTFNKIFSWSCAKQGTTGSSATSYKMIVSHAAIVQDESGTYSPDSITLTGKSQTGASSMASYSARFKIFLNGSTTASYTSSANESSVTYTIPDGTTSVRCVMYKAGGTSTILDEQTIPVVSDGVSITSVTNKYAVSSSNSTAPTTWYDAVQTMTSTNRYLWSYEIITYSNGNTSETDKRVIGVYGNTGATGNGISNITEYYLASSASSGVTTSTSGWATTIQTTTTTNKYLWNYEVVTYTNGDTYTSTPVIIGTHGATGSAGTGYTVVLSNESHTFAGGTSTAVATTTSTSVIAYKNTSQIAATITKIGSTSVSGNAAGIATGITGLTASVTNNGTTSCSITFSATTSLTTKSGTIAITLTVGGKTFTKNFSFSLALTGATGTAAKSVDITASSQVFKSTDGGSTFSPDTIKLTPVFQGGISYSKWQYSTNGGSSWTDVSSGSHGLTISSGVLSIAKTSDLFTETVTSISFKCISSNSTYYDIMTVLKLYDVTDIEIGVRNLVKNSNFYMGKSKWGIAGVTVNILDDDFYGHVAQIISPNTGSASFRIYTDINSNFSFEIDVLYTISFYAKADSDCNIQTNIAGGTQSVNHALTTAWERYSYTLTASKTGSLTFWSVSAGTTFYITNIQIEHGNKATDWSPAPEDLQNQITTITDTISGVESKVNANTKSITDKVWQIDISTSINEYDGSTVKTIRDRVTSTEKDISGMKTTLSNVQTTVSKKADGSTVQTLSTKVATMESDFNGFKTTVSNTYTTKEDFNNLEIGGRNLIRNSDLGANNSTASYDESTKIWTINATAGAGGTWGCGLVIKNKNALVPYGKSYVLSFEIKVPRACSWNCDINNYAITGSSWSGNDNDSTSKRKNNIKTLVTNQWIKCWVVWVNANTNNTNKVDLYDSSNFGVVMKDETSNMTYYIRNVKGELGNIPTDWTPAPEDVEQSITSVSSQYTQLSNKFNWVVKSGTSSSDFTITDRMISLTSSALHIDALTTFKNSAENGTSTVINGGAIKANTITTSKLATDAIKSINYSYSSGNFSSAGTFLDLSTGLVRSKNFAIDSSGNAYFKGNVQANAGYIGGTSGWAITTNTITGNANSKIISGILESSNYVENSTGVQMNLNTGIIKGNIEASTLAAKDAIKIYVGNTKRNVITGHLENDFFCTRIGCDLTIGDVSRVKPSIILNKSTVSTSVSDMITIYTEVLDIEANTSIVGSLTATRMETYTNGGSWISGKTSAAINILTTQFEDSFHPVLRISSYSGNVWCLGGLGDTVGIYGYYSGRTTNGYDWCTTWDTSNGNLTTTNNISCNDIMTRTGWASDRLSHGETAYSNLMNGRFSFKWLQNSSGVWRIYVYVDGALVRDW